MSNPAPILTLAGRCHAVTVRPVAAAPAREATYDDDGRMVTPAYPARDGYDVVDVTVLTSEGGFATASILPPEMEALGGEMPDPGTEVDFAVRPFVLWQKAGARSYSRVGLSVSGDLTAKRRNSGRRVSPVAASA